MKIWISDQDETPQRFPLQRLLRRVRDCAAPSAATCELRRASGYGDRINELAAEVDSVESISVDLAELDALAAGIEEWFYDVQLTLPEHAVTFGLHDSAALFVEGPDALVREIASAFSSVTPTP